MDGREDKNQNPNPTENPVSVPGAIFTPQEELIEVEETTPSVDNPQPVQPVLVSSNVTTASGTGDIKLPREKKSRKGLVVFLVVLALAVLGSGVIWLLTTRLAGTSAKMTLTLFQDYISYAKDGPRVDTNDDNTTNNDSLAYDDWYINKLYDLNLSRAEIEGYLTELNVRYYDFYNQSKHEDLDAAIDMHKQLLTIITNYYSLNDLYDNVVAKYNHGGNEEAQKYIDQRAPAVATSEDGDESIIDAAARLERAYLVAKLTILHQYESHGCIINGEIDFDCVADISNSQVQLAEDKATELRESISVLIPFIQERYCISADAILNYLEKV